MLMRGLRHPRHARQRLIMPLATVIGADQGFFAPLRTSLTNTGEGSVSFDRSSDATHKNPGGPLILIPPNEPRFDGARVDLDPTQLFVEFTTTEGTASPLPNFLVTCAGSTWMRRDADESDNLIALSPRLLSGAAYTNGVPAGTRISVYVGNTEHCTKLFSQYSQLAGSLPDLSASPAFVQLLFQHNRLTGSIHSLSANTALVQYYCYNNQLTGFAGGWPNKAFRLNASANALTEEAVNRLLIDAATYGIPIGTTINLEGGTNAAPTGLGLTAKSDLIAAGATVSTN